MLKDTFEFMLTKTKTSNETILLTDCSLCIQSLIQLISLCSFIMMNMDTVYMGLTQNKLQSCCFKYSPEHQMCINL